MNYYNNLYEQHVNATYTVDSEYLDNFSLCLYYKDGTSALNQYAMSYSTKFLDIVDYIYDNVENELNFVLYKYDDMIYIHYNTNMTYLILDNIDGVDSIYVTQSYYSGDTAIGSGTAQSNYLNDGLSYTTYSRTVNEQTSLLYENTRSFEYFNDKYNNLGYFNKITSYPLELAPEDIDTALFVLNYSDYPNNGNQYKDGYDVGYYDGTQNGYNNGFRDGYNKGLLTEEKASAFTYIGNAFNSVNGILQLEVLPHVTLGTCFTIPFVIAMIKLVFMMVKK